jgi:histidinol-phosphate phosphatase family protein
VVKKRFAVFADRDGVINKEVDNLHRIEDLEILPRVPKAIKLLNQHQIPFIVITNQPVVARGWLTEEGVQRIHDKIQEILHAQGVEIDRFYFCPHHPNADLKKYRVVCDCRKPAIGLFKKAAKDFGVDLKKSYIVGDSFRDIEAGKQLGATAIFVKSGARDLRGSTPNYSFKDLYEVVKFILKREKIA